MTRSGDRSYSAPETAPATRPAAGAPSRRVVAAVALLLLLAAIELATRAIFPLPELLDFQRLRYAQGSRNGGPVQSLAHATLWWWSEPDGAAFSRRANLYGFHDGEWRLRPRRGRPRVAFVGDSFVEGLGTRDRGTLVDAFEREAERSEIELEALNLGAAGFGFADYAGLIRDATQLFRPDDLVLVVYMNDAYRLPDITGSLEGPVEPERSNRWLPRLFYVVSWLRADRQVPLRWHEPAGSEPEPLAVAPRLAADPLLAANIERFLEPDLAAAMKAGRLNPAITNLLARSERVLPEPVDFEPQIGALRRFADRASTRLWVVYLPSLNQVSDAYLPAQRRMSGPTRADSLTGERFQEHARDLGRACAQHGVSYLDLTPELAAAEARGERLYWPYDAHMTEAGYSEVGRAIFQWWAAERSR